MACGLFLFGLFFMVLSSPSSASDGDIKPEQSWLLQPQRFVSARIGDNVLLECEVHNNLIPGVVKWYLGEGPQRKLIFEEEITAKNSTGPYVDYSVLILNVTQKDAGTYYCVREKKVDQGTTDWLKGLGTLLVVKGLHGQSLYGLYLGLFLNKVAGILLLFGLFQIKQNRGCLARCLAKCRSI